jgi:hypothetical protein
MPFIWLQQTFPKRLWAVGLKDWLKGWFGHEKAG